MTEIEQLKAILAEASQRIAAIEAAEAAQAEETWPKDGDTYWAIEDDGAEAFISTWASDDTDCARMAIGNVFRTRADAEREAERRKVLTRLRQLAQNASNSANRGIFFSVASPATVLALLDELDNTRKAMNAAKALIKSQEGTISHMRSNAEQNKEAITTLDSERAANAAMTEEVDRLRTIEAAARNLVKVKGRRHAEIAYQKLVEVLK